MHFQVKNIAAFSLVILMLTKMMGMPIAWLSYTINKDYIAAQLCENKNRPALHCNGQCILMKKLAKANESNESKQNKTEVKTLSIDFVEELKSYSIIKITATTPVRNLFRNKMYASAIQTDIFHPPADIA
jgi:hypothetical protein